MPAYSRKAKVSQVSVMWVDSLVSTRRITEPLPCTLQDTPFSHSFLILPKCPAPILGRDLLSKVKASITISSPPSDLAWLVPQPHLLFPSPNVPRASKPQSLGYRQPSVAFHHAPIYIRLKDHSNCPINHNTPSPKNINKG